MDHVLETRLLCQRFIEIINNVCNGVTFICSFVCNPGNTITEDLSNFLLDGEFTKQIFLLDRSSEVFNYAEFDADLETFVYSEAKNCFVKEPLELKINTISQEKAVTTYIGFLTSSKSPYQKQIHLNEASEIVNEFFRLLKEKEKEANPLYYALEPNFLFAQGDSELKTQSDYIPYFDQGHFDSCTIIKFPDLAYMVLTNGCP